MGAAQLPRIQYDMIPLTGGLDLITPTLNLRPGICRDALNFECAITGGYTRIAGYERYDGRTKPSDASYAAYTVSFSATVAAGDTITGGTSGATAYVLSVGSNYLIVTKVTGTFVAAEALKVLGVTKATLTALGAPVVFTALQNATFLALAADAYRLDILVVPGSGQIRGVAYFGGTVYAWRNNAGGTALAMYKSSSSGWQAVTLTEEISFTNANTSVNDGDTLTQGAVTATVQRVVVQTGTLLSGTNTGRLIITSRSGGNFAAGAASSTGGGALTLSGAQTAIALLPGGRVETAEANFGGTTGTTKLYIVDGVNRAHEFDGTVMVPVATGMTVDRPTHVATHKGQLFLSFGSSVQFSAIGQPYVWSVTVGAGELSADGIVTNMVVQPGDQTTGAIAIYSDSSTQILYGSSSSDYALKTFNSGTGAKAYSGQNMSATYVFDTRGVMSLQTSWNFGNFDTAAFSLNIRPWVQQRRSLVTASSINREKSQYRIYFSDGSALYMTIVNGKLVGSMPMSFPNPALVACGGEITGGSETTFFGSSNGYVYRLDAGTSFDGAEIPYYLTLTWNSIKNPRLIKKFRKLSLEMSGNAFAQFSLSYELSYGSSEKEQGSPATYDMPVSSVYWDSFTWDSFTWDGRTLAPSEIELMGSAENIALRIGGSSAAFSSFTVNSAIMHYAFRRSLR